MDQKANLPANDLARDKRTHGSSLHTQPTALDQERAASMADEGGVSGAITDTAEQESPLSVRVEWSGLRRWLPWIATVAAAAAGCAGLMLLLRPRR